MPADPRRVVGDDELVRVQHAAGRPTAGPGPRRGARSRSLMWPGCGRPPRTSAPPHRNAASFGPRSSPAAGHLRLGTPSEVAARELVRSWADHEARLAQQHADLDAARDADQRGVATLSRLSMPSSYRTELGGRRGRGYACPGPRRWYEPNDQAVDWLLLFRNKPGPAAPPAGPCPPRRCPSPWADHRLGASPPTRAR
jgi:hypothetical protein